MDLLTSLNHRKCNIIFLISAPSGTGKSSVCRRILEKVSNIEYSVSFTTRKPREGEVDGKDYYFIESPAFKEMIRNNEFAEWELVHENFYGTAIKSISNAFKKKHDLLLDIDVKGAKKIRKLYHDAVFIYLLPPSFSELKLRLENRMTENSEEIEMRFKNALGELLHFIEYDFAIFNDNLDVAVNKILSIIEIEKYRVSRIDKLEEIKNKIKELSSSER